MILFMSSVTTPLSPFPVLEVASSLLCGYHGSSLVALDYSVAQPWLVDPGVFLIRFLVVLELQLRKRS